MSTNGTEDDMKRRDFLLGGGMMLTASALLSRVAAAAETGEASGFPTVLPPTMNGDVKEFRLYIDLFEQTLAPGMTMHTLAFNGQVPGPEIRVQAGDKVRVYFENRTDLNHTIHWHGVYVPWRMDGVPYVTQMPVMPGQTFVYEFEAQPYGTHFYHCHWGTLLHMQSGMYGSLIIEAPEGEDPIQERFPYDREYSLIYSAHDVNFVRAELNAMLERMKERRYLMQKGRFDPERFAVFDSLAALQEAVDGGYVPPYLVSRRAPADLPVPNWFTVNGKSYPMTPYLGIREGERIRVRLMNGGTENHHLHLHGHDFWVVCNDGVPLEHPYQGNTVSLSPGKTIDLIIEGSNRGIWTFHDHDTRRVTNNGLYPGGNLLALVYEDLPEMERMVTMAGDTGASGMAGMSMKKNLLPKVALDE